MITNFGASIDKYLSDKIADDDRDYSYLHPSDFGNCLVATWLKTKGVKPLVPFNAGKVRIFDNGHFVHLRNQIYAKESGVLAKDKVISKSKPHEITIGLEPKTKILIEGESGRQYYYSPQEIIWRVERKKTKNDLNLYLGTDPAPYWDTIDNLEKGEEWWLVEVPLVDTEHHFGGHCDAIILNDGVETVVDYKGTGEYSWGYIFHDSESKYNGYRSNGPGSFNDTCFICNQNMKQAKDLSAHLASCHLDDIVLDFKYKVQLHIYMMILGLEQSILWYENKSNQIVIDYLVKKDDELIEKIKINSGKLWNKILSGTKPDRKPLQKRTNRPCSWCDYASQCWNWES